MMNAEEEDIPSKEGPTARLKNEDTERALQFIEELHNLGVSSYVDLPQLVAVGDQSSGKSSVLQAITKLPFPVSDKMCTRHPTEVSLRFAPGPSEMSVCIKIHESSHFSDDHRRSVEDWTSTILDLERPDFPEDFAAILKEGSELLLGDKKAEHSLSESTLQISIRGSCQPNLTIVDIPGLVSAGHEAYDTARALVQHYIDNPKCIILAVAHPADPETQEVFQILKSIAQKKSRVIGVITKCDRKQKGAENWILEAIKNAHHPQNPYYLTQGWFGLRNRLPNETDTSNEERDRAESGEFRKPVWEGLNEPTRLGIVSLRAALITMHNNHIMGSIPDLIPNISGRLESCISKLKALGPSRSTKEAQLSCLVKLASEFEKLSTYALDGHYDKLPSESRVKIRKIVHENLEKFQDAMKYTSDEYFGGKAEFEFSSADESEWENCMLQDPVYQEILEVIRDNRGKESPGEVNPCVMNVLWGRRTADWQEMAMHVINDLVKSIAEVVKLLFERICPDKQLRHKSQRWMAEHLTSVSELAIKELQDLVVDERNGFVWTLNPQRLYNMVALKEDRISAMTDKLITFFKFSKDTTSDAIRIWVGNKVKAYIGRSKNVASVFDTYDRLASCYEISMHRFVDNVAHQVVERHLLGPMSPLRIFNPEFVVTGLQGNEEKLRQIAGEDEGRAAERSALEAEKLSLEMAITTARNYGFGIN